MRDKHMFLLFTVLIYVSHIHSSKGVPVNKLVSCSPTWQAVGGECFWISEVQRNWNSAQEECEQMDGNLAEPQDLEMLRTYINSNKLHGDYWLGGMRDDSSSNWKWLSGRPLTDAFQEGRGDRGFKCLDFQSNNSPSLNDYGCDNDQFFICEGPVSFEEETVKSVPSSVVNVNVTSVRSMGISLAWEAPNDPSSEIEMYEVLYYEKYNPTNWFFMLTTKQEASLGGLRQRTMYGFQVRARSAQGLGEYSAPIYKWTGNVQTPDILDCSSISTCSSCVSNPSCDWCLADFRCTSALANTCNNTDVVVYAHYPNGTNIGKRFRNGPSFCPQLDKPQWSYWIARGSSNQTSSFTVAAAIIPTFMQNFTCQLNWEENRELFQIESLGIKQHKWSGDTHDGSTIKCEDMKIPEIHTSEVVANFTLKYNGNVIESPNVTQVLIYSCLYLSSNCEDCASHVSPYHCGWCIPTGTCITHYKNCPTKDERNEYINSEWKAAEKCPASPNITALEWCESPLVAIGSECFFISNIGHEMEGQTLNNRTWNDARTFCQERGEDLAQPYKIKLIREFLEKSENQDAIKSKYWIGGRHEPPNLYFWTSGDLLRRDWVSGSYPADHNCVQYESGWNAPYLSRQNCSEAQPWICEKTNIEPLV